MPRPGRVVFFAAYPHVYGGVERGLELLVAGLQERGWAAEIVLPATGSTADRWRAAGLAVDVVEAPPALLVYGRGTPTTRAAAALPSYWARLRRRIRGADVVHAFSQRGVLLAGPAARLARVPVVWHVGGHDPGWALNRGAARLANAVIAVSHSATVDLPRTRVTVVPNAVDPAAFEPPAERELDGVTVVCATRLTPEKGVDVLVRAAAMVRREKPDVRVVVFGGVQNGHESYRSELDSLAAELGVTDAVSFRGFVEEPFRHWAGAGVYVQPSRREGFGLAAAEAMASNLPVVASAVGGLPDVLDDGQAGVLVPPDDAAALAGAVRALLDDPSRARQLAACGRQRAATHYTVERMLDGVEAVYRRLLA